MRVSINGQFGDSLLLTPGKMVIMRPDAKRIPDPVTVDLKKLVKTSTLVNMHGGKKGKDKPLPSMALIDQAIDQQQIAKNDHHLIDTNLVILGKGTNVLLGSTDLMRYLDNRTDVVKTESSPAPGTPASTPGPTPISTPTPPPLPDVGASPTIKVSGDKKHTDVRYGDKQPLTSPLVLNTAQDYSKNGGNGSIKINSNDSVTVNSMLKVSGSTSDKGHGEISIKSAKTNGTAITVSSSAQLLALLNATSKDKGNKITFQSAGGAIDVAGQLQADQGTIDIRNNGLNGNVALNNATLSASTIKVGALGNNGTLTIGGGSMSADNMIKLYAGGSNGTVIFVDDVTLNGKSLKTIAGDTVTIVDGKVVTVHGPGPVSVFTNHPNYTGWGGNGSTTGTFAGNGAVTQPLSNKPGF
jgi:hypothetical protein